MSTSLIIPFFSLLFFASNVLAGTSYVSTSSDSGSGSLREAIEDVNSAAGSGTVAWLESGGESIVIKSNLDTIKDGTTLDVTDSTSAVSISGSYKMPIAGEVTFSNDNVSSTWTIAAIISGSGTLIKTGDGDLTLTNDNTYSGGTELDGGVLTISKDSNLGASSGGLTFNGGKLQLTDGITTRRSITVASGGGTIDTGSNDMYSHGAVDGTGTLTKEGTGTLVLSGTNTCTGATVISSGSIIAGTDGALASGALSVSGDGVYDMQGYTQTVSEYSNSGALRLTLASGTTNLTVTGEAELAGTLYISLTPRLYYTGETFTPIAAGVLSGEFSSIYSPAAVSFTPTYENDELLLTASLVPFADSVSTRNQRAVAEMLEPLRDDPAGDMATVMGNLYTLDADELRAALDEIGPASLGSVRGLAMAGSSVQSSVLSRRMDIITGEGERFAPQLFSLGEENSPEGASKSEAGDGAIGPRHARQAGDGAIGPRHARQAGNEAKTGGGSPFGFFADVAGTGGNVRNSEASYSFGSGGLIGGVDGRISEHFAVGLAGGYVYGKASPSGGGNVKEDSLRYGVYAAGRAGSFHLNLYAGGAADSFTSERGVSFGEISRTATGKPDGSEVNLYADARYEFRPSAATMLAPVASVNYDKLHVDGFSESGADSLDLSVNSQTAESMRGKLGIRYSASHNVGSCAMLTHLTAAWRHEFKSQSDITARLISGGDEFSVSPGELGSNGFVLALGLLFNWGRTSLNLDYSGDFNSTASVHTLNSGVHFKF